MIFAVEENSGKHFYIGLKILEFFRILVSASMVNFFLKQYADSTLLEKAKGRPVYIMAPE